jgi:hypothetical protein
MVCSLNHLRLRLRDHLQSAVRIAVSEHRLNIRGGGSLAIAPSRKSLK